MVWIRPGDEVRVRHAAADPITPGLSTVPVLSPAMELDERPLVIASAVGVVLGSAAVIAGTTLMATVGVVMIVLSVVAFLLAVGTYFEESEPVEAR